MLSRRLIRIKVMQTLYAHFKANNPTISHSEKELHHCLGKTEELFYLIMLLLFDIQSSFGERIELKKQKRIPTETDLAPNARFVNNKLLAQLQKNNTRTDLHSWRCCRR